MKFYRSIALAAFIAQADAYDPMAGYLTGSAVVDHGAMDVDQAGLESAIGDKTEDAFAAGLAVYTSGGGSKAVGSLTLASALTADVAKNTVMVGTGVGGGVVTGTVYSDTAAGATEIELKYDASTCQELPADEPNTDGCFASDGTGFALDGTVTDGTNVLAYTAATNVFKRTLKGFSTAVESKMSDETHANYFKDYYGVYDYADQIVQAAFAGTATEMTGGNSDFSAIGFIGREQVIKKCVAYMNVFMYAIHEFEAAIGKCVPGVQFDQYNAVHAWDEGVAFYVGNMEGVDGSGSGKLVYNLADKRGGDFGIGTEVNTEFIALSNRGNLELQSGDCDAAEATKNEIIDIIYIPLIQGSLKYAFKSTDEKAKAEGTAFMHAVIGRVNAASPAAASIIYDELKATGTFDEAAVKDAFESVYDDLGLTCEQVGELQSDGFVYEGMEACKTKCTDKSGKKSKFTLPSTGLSVTCGDLTAVDEATREFMCSAGGDVTCPLTCSGSCDCTDDPAATTNGKTCTEIAAMGNKKRKSFCKKDGAKDVCPKSCKGWCAIDPFA